MLSGACLMLKELSPPPMVLSEGILPSSCNAVLQAVELPTSIANLHPSLSNVDGDTLTVHCSEREKLAQKTKQLLQL